MKYFKIIILLFLISFKTFSLSTIFGIYSVAYSKNGKYLASGSYNVKIWDIKNRKLLKTIKTNFFSLKLHFSSDNKYLFASSFDSKIRIINYKKGKIIKTISAAIERIKDFVLSKDNKYIIAINRTGKICIWDYKTLKLIVKKNSRAYGENSINISDNNELIIYSSGSKNIFIKTRRDFKTIKIIKTLPYASAFSIATSPDSKKIASSGYLKTIFIWSRKTGKLLKKLKYHKAHVRKLLFVGRNNLLLSASDDKKIILWNIKTGKILKIHNGHLRGVRDISISPDKKYFVSCSTDFNVILWTLKTGKIVAKFKHL